MACLAATPVNHLAMETPTTAADPHSPTEDSISGFSGSRDSLRSESLGLEEGCGRDEEFELPEYERLRQENLRKNSLKLQELGIPVLTASLNISTTTCTTSAVGGEGNLPHVKTPHTGGAINLENHCYDLRYRNPKPCLQFRSSHPPPFIVST